MDNFASAIPWITPQKHDGNLKRAAKIKQNSTAKKERYSSAEIDSLFAYYLKKYRNIKTINNPENSEARTSSKLGMTGLDDDNNILQLCEPLDGQTSNSVQIAVEKAESMLKNTNRKNKRNIEAKKKRYSPAEIDSLFSRYFEQYKNMKTITNREHFEVNSKTIVLEDTNKLPLNIVLKNQKSKPMEEVSKNVDSKLKITKHKNKRSFQAKKKKISPAEIDSLFSSYFEEYKNLKSINNPVNSEENAGPEDTTNMLPFNALLEDQKSKPMEEVLENAESKLKNTNHKNKRSFDAKKKRYSPEEIDSLFASYFEEYKNMKMTNKREHFEVIEDTNNKLPLNIVLENQKSKPMELSPLIIKSSNNVDSKLEITNRKNKRSFEANKKRCSPAEIDSLFAYYFKKYKKIKTINNPENSDARTPSKLGMTGLDDNNNLQLSEPLDGQTSNSIRIAVEKAESKRKITMAKEKRNSKTKNKYYYCPEIDSIFANCFEKYRRNITIDYSDVTVSKRESILGSTGLKVASNILPINPFKDKESFSCWKFTDPLVI
ncbi:uncharacterized protein LOC117571112 isoform X2 [Drosophila albomicans]|uniref:Uncharacterized protein LOC117571112 isoform X2 n=1 Tax=Drosophila albomicans TaxID=7291 RepID=A0A6P8X7U9_DROAB|nr:uncharacterized protein LOC117571112 isoform X2 [Drosophila albomicans]